MSIQRRSKTVASHHALITPDDSFTKDEVKHGSKFYSWKRINKRHHTTTTYLDPEPIFSFKSNPTLQSYSNVTIEPQLETLNQIEVESEPEQNEITSVEEDKEEVTLQEQEVETSIQDQTPSCSQSQLTGEAEESTNQQEQFVSSAEVSFNNQYKELSGSPDYIIARNNTLEDVEINQSSLIGEFPTPRVSLNEIPVVHRPLKDLINKTYKDFYNTDGNKIHIKAGLSKRTVSSLPSLHPSIKRKE